MKETPNSWIITANNYDRSKKQRDDKRRNNPDPRFNVLVCPKCNRVHEQYYNTGVGVERNYYDDFPRYKLGKRKCVECDGQ